MMWRHVYPTGPRSSASTTASPTKHYSEVRGEKIAAGDVRSRSRRNGAPEQKVTWHDSCHIGRVSGVYEPPRDLIKAIPDVEFVEMPYNREEAHCCGSVLTLIKDPDVAAASATRSTRKPRRSARDKILARCPCCEFQLRVAGNANDSDIEVVDLARFAPRPSATSSPTRTPRSRRSGRSSRR